MSISSIFQIADRLLNRDLPRNSEHSANPKPAQSDAANTIAVHGDRFTSSEQTGAANIAGEAGIFQFEKLRFTAVSVQTTGANNAAPAPAPSTGQTATPLTTTAPIPLPAVNTAPQAAPAVATATGQTATTPPVAILPAINIVPAVAAQAAPQSVAQSQAALQALNSALVALGLDPAAIAAFDQFAGVLLQINPNALQDLQTQLNSLAQQFTTSTGTAATQAPTNTTAAPAANAAANPPGFQLTALSIKFTGINETVQQAGQNGNPGTTTQISAFRLQIREVSVSLAAPNGQAVQLQSPQANAATPAAPAVPTAAKAATA